MTVFQQQACCDVLFLTLLR